MLWNEKESKGWMMLITIVSNLGDAIYYDHVSFPDRSGSLANAGTHIEAKGGEV